MKYRYIKDLKISEIGLGTWALGGPSFDPLKGYPTGWQEIKETEAIAGIRYALEQGVNHFDTADVYGLGKAERILAKGLGKDSDKVVIASKVGYVKGSSEFSYNPFHIQQQLEQSLINLKRDYIDIYYFHHTNFGPDNYYLEPALELFQKLKKQGKIRYIGLSSYSTTDFIKYISIIKPDVIQCQASLVNYKIIKEKSLVTQLLEKENIGCIAFSPFAQGLLLDKFKADQSVKFVKGDFRANNTYFTKPYLKNFEPKLAQIKERFGASKEDLARVALQFLLHFYHVTGTIPGFRNKEQVALNLKFADKRLTSEDISFITQKLK